MVISVTDTVTVPPSGSTIVSPKGSASEVNMGTLFYAVKKAGGMLPLNLGALLVTKTEIVAVVDRGYGSEAVK